MSDVSMLHRRMDMINNRLAQIEHYLGMRHHRFPANDDVWGFQQIKQDVQQPGPPRSRFHTGENRLRRVK